MTFRRLGTGLLVVAGLGGCAWCVAGRAPEQARPAETLHDRGAEGGLPPSRSPLDGDLRGRGPVLAEPGSAPPAADASSPRTPPQAAEAANGGYVPSATSPPTRRVQGHRFLLGVNEGVSVPRRLLEHGLAEDRLARMLRGDATALRGLGATLVRGHTGAFPRTSMSEWNVQTRAELDLCVRTVQDAGLTPIGMVSPWPANHTANHTDQYVPVDLAAYRAYVTVVVERYDGDGVDDMPGLAAPVRYWEVDNEPDLKFTRAPRPPREGVVAPPPPAPGTFCTPEAYAQVLLASSSAIRAAAPDATILAFGLLQPHRETGVDYLRRGLAVEGVRAAFDVLSVHGYAADGGVSLAEGVARVRALVPDVPVWVTETSASSAKDEERQARLVVALAARAAEAGASALLWHTLADPPSRDEAGTRDGGPDRDGSGEALRRGSPPPPQDRRGQGVPSALAHNSLFQTGADGALIPKPASSVYAELATILRAHDLVGARSEGEGMTLLADGSRLLWKGSAVASGGGRDLRRGRDLAPGETATAPAWLTAPPDVPAR